MGAFALMLLLLLLLGGLVARGAAWSASCATDLDCSLNGVCTSGFCVCDKGWVSADHTGKGSHAGGCGLLDFKPAPSSVSAHCCRRRAPSAPQRTLGSSSTSSLQRSAPAARTRARTGGDKQPGG